MNWFKNLRMAQKLMLCFGACVALMGVMGYVTWTGFARTSSAIHNLGNKTLPGVADLGLFATEARQFRVTQFRMALTTDPATIADLNKRQKDAQDAATKAIDSFVVLSKGTPLEADGKELAKLWGEYIEINQTILGDLRKLKAEAGGALVEEKCTPLFVGKVIPLTNKLLEAADKEGKAAALRAEQAASNAQRQSIMFMLVAVVIAVGSGVVLTRSLTTVTAGLIGRMQSLEENCLRGLESAVEALSRGDLTASMEAKTTSLNYQSKDELGTLVATFNDMLARVQSTIRSFGVAQGSLKDMVVKVSDSSVRVNETSETLAAATQQSGSSSNEIARGSEKLAHTATEASATMETLIESITRVSESSADQSRLLSSANQGLHQAVEGVERVTASAQTMAAVAQDGNTAVAETVKAIQRLQAQVEVSSSKVKELDEKGQQIGQIVSAIEQIAEQTNLLALNAAIEAARAGEHGRGFAVVADEVRKLAEQAGSATKEISSLIEGVRATVLETVSAIERTNHEVESGTERSEQAGKALSQIVSAAQTVAHQSEEVAKTAQAVSRSMTQVQTAADQNQGATREMEGHAQRVAGAITNVAAISEETAAGAEELSATAEEVSDSATQLNVMANELKALVATFKIREDREAWSETKRTVMGLNNGSDRMAA